jgi:RNA polymerase sigma-70 factor (ECF subfamily)
MRWELNDLARRLDEHPAALRIDEEAVRAPSLSSTSSLTPSHRGVLQAIDDLPDDEREVFGLVRVQGLTHAEAGEVIGVSVKTVQRRLNRAMVLLCKELEHLRPTKT